jgi:hypothetical protein
MITLLLFLAAQETGCFPATADRLSNDDIDIREQALADLVKRGPKAVPAIRAALAKATDTELKGRLELALKALTEVRWLDDLEAAQKAAAADKKMLLVYVTRGPVNGWS